MEGIHILNKKDSCVNIICGLEIDKSWKSYFKRAISWLDLHRQFLEFPLAVMFFAF